MYCNNIFTSRFEAHSYDENIFNQITATIYKLNANQLSIIYSLISHFYIHTSVVLSLTQLNSNCW